MHDIIIFFSIELASSWKIQKQRLIYISYDLLLKYCRNQDSCWALYRNYEVHEKYHEGEYGFCIDSQTLGRWLMWIVKRNGTNIVSCGTPILIVRWHEIWTISSCSDSFLAFPLIPYLLRIQNRILWYSQSKASEKSKKRLAEFQ